MDYLNPKTRKDPFPQFKNLLFASIVYAVVFTFCRYKSSYGIAVSLNYIATLGYLFYILKTFGLKIKKGFIFTALVYLLVGLNIFHTSNHTILAFDSIGGALILLCGLLHECYDDSQWGFGKYFTALNQFFWCSFGHVADPYIDASHNIKQETGESRNGNAKYIIFGLLAVIPVAIVVLLLLSSADLMFSHMFESFFKFIEFTDIFICLFMAFAAFSASYALMRKLSFHDINENAYNIKKLNPIAGISFNTVLCIIYLIFSVFQFVFLFFGAGLPEEYTYAEYAHEGFYQLVAVSILNIVIVFVSKVIFDKSKILNAVLTVTSLCTFVMIASSFYRMILYIKAYRLTELRILTIWSLVVITLIMAAVCVYIYCPSFPITKVIVIIVSCLYILLAYSHPNRIIAVHNMKSYLETGRGDLNYISYLDESVDAYIYADEYIATHSEGANPFIDNTLLEISRKNFVSHTLDSYDTEESDLRKCKKFNLYQSKALKYAKEHNPEKKEKEQ